MNFEKKIICQGIKINYTDRGEGDIILFVHNGGGFWQIWTKQIEFFSTTHRVIALDLPGFGESDESEKPYDLDFNFKVLIDFIDGLELNHLNLIGNCIGASLAIKYAEQYPERVNKLVLMNICPGERLVRSKVMRHLLFKTSSTSTKTSLRKILQFAFTKTAVRNKFPSILFGPKPDKSTDLFQKYKRKFATEKQTRSRLNLLFASNSYTLKNFLLATENISNSLLIWGENNKVASWKREGIYHRDICNITNYSILGNAGHLCMYECPEETNSLIRKHLEC